ncbi:hypothetical protein JCM11251_000139 [Rhodosporidiobolus azoricus]
MIALGRTIDTGLVIRAGSALNTGRAAGIFLGYTIKYTIVGAVVYSMMVALGEMAVFIRDYAGTSLPQFSLRVGTDGYAFSHLIATAHVVLTIPRTLQYSPAITIPTEIGAASIVLQYWDGAAEVNMSVWITVFLVVIRTFNFIGVGAFGEAEFWSSLIKITPFQQLNGIPGSLGRFASFWTVFVQAAFSFLGTEIVALTAGEAENPRRNFPKAINRVFWRIIFFYVIGVLMLSLIVDPNNPGLLNGHSDASASPWVIGVQAAGIKVVPHIINAVILIAAFACLAVLFLTLFKLIVLRLTAPKIFRYCTKNGLPIWSLVATSPWSFLAYMCVSTGGNTGFNYLVSISFLRFYHAGQKQGLDRKEFPYVAPLQPYLSYFGFFMVTVIILFSDYTVFLDGNWDVDVFCTSYVTIPWFAFMFIANKLWKKTTFFRLSDMDFETNRRELDAMVDDQQALYKPPCNFIGRVRDWIM